MTQNMSGNWAAETSSEWEHRCPLASFKLPDLVTVRRMLEPGEDDELPGEHTQFKEGALRQDDRAMYGLPKPNSALTMCVMAGKNYSVKSRV
ncbi:hypothetical protein L6452_33145 [Arctium lappa]|uniref:Uncharacterized protein n=1 Tax=Arctium lappa TaxID=4217 RepID=A0ACB8Z7H2_ARCLA|nr:hypothetical protein L6452_33145 [Arctium lappa]